ncbi:MAG TPA: hypothetical protein VF893_04020 [Candidatus Bathyarchaeia archaeon]
MRTKDQAFTVASAGADAIVTGNITESNDAGQKISEIVEGIRSAKV